jgi:hypothetical protein
MVSGAIEVFQGSMLLPVAQGIVFSFELAGFHSFCIGELSYLHCVVQVVTDVATHATALDHLLP